MGLKGGIQGRNNLRLTGASGSLSLTVGNGARYLPIVTRNQYYGVPGGYPAGRAFTAPIKTGGIGSIVRGTSSSSSSPFVTVQRQGTSDGVATTAGNAFVTYSRAATAAGIASSSSTIEGRGVISSSLYIGAQPTAEDVAQAVWNGLALESGYTARDLMRLIAAFAAGDKNATTLKAAGNDAKTRITYSASGETRSVTGIDTGD